MDLINELRERLTILEHVLKVVSECPNCPGCQSVAKQYFDCMANNENGNSNVTNIKVQQKS